MEGIFANILCPLDFDDQSLSAIEIAQNALQSGGRIHFLHLRTFPFALTPKEAELPLAESKERLETILREALGSQVAYDAAVDSSDDIAKSIVDYAHNLNSDCIVLGTHARTGVDKLLLGSITERVIRDAQCPVLTIAQPAIPLPQAS